MSASVELRGADGLSDGLSAVADRLEDWDALETVAGDWRARGAQRAPRLSGALAASLHVETVSPGWPAVVSSLPYARVIHNGSRARGITANPFLLDTVDPGDAAETLAADLAGAFREIRGA